MQREAQRWLRVRALMVSSVLCASSACHRGPTTATTLAPSSLSFEATTSGRARIPRNAARFEIEAVTDSSVQFQSHEVDWLRTGMTAYVVDPLHRDALIAKVRVSEVLAARISATISSQVTRVTTDHVLLVSQPTASWWNSRRFWFGALTGSVVGGALGASIRH